MMEGRDWAAVERTLRELLELQPNNSAALANLVIAQRERAKLSVFQAVISGNE